MRELLIQVARILTESDVYRCGFTVIGDSIYAVLIRDKRTEFMEIDPAKWLGTIHGA